MLPLTACANHVSPHVRTPPQWDSQHPVRCTWLKRESYEMTLLFSHSSNCRFNASERINNKWFLRVYWLLPFSIVDCFLLASSLLLFSTVDSFAEHRRFFCWAPTTLLLSTINTWTIQLTSFPQGVIFYFTRLFLFINWNSRMLGKSHTESTDTCYMAILFFLLLTILFPASSRHLSIMLLNVR